MIINQNVQTIILPNGFSENQKKMWKSVPLSLPIEEVEKTNQLLARMANPLEMDPTTLLNIDRETVLKYPLIGAISRKFKDCMEEYRDPLEVVITSDRELYQKLKEESYVGPIKGGAIGFIKSHEWLWRNAKVNAHLIYQVPFTPLLWIGGIFYGVCNVFGGYLNEEAILPLASKHRIKWLNEMIIKDKLLREYQVFLMKARMEVLQKELENLDEGFTHEDYVEEMILLDRLMTVISPTTALKINDLPVTNFLEKYIPNYENK